MDNAVTKMKFIAETNAAQIYVPANIILDSTFPFEKKDQSVVIRIEGDKLVIEKGDD